jgi:diguanylate cyclase (GGDEF)-like protein
LHDDVIYRVLDDGEGNFWMSCNRGVFRVARKDFDRFDAGAIPKIPSVSFSQADGMRSPECNGGFQPAGWRTPDGRLWFPTVGGAAVIDPHRMPTNVLPPPVLVEALVVDTALVPLEASRRIPPGKGRLEFRYTALSFVAPEKVLFRYRLEGFDRDWVDAGTRRAAYYTNLPPGDYVFRVTACNDSGLWNTEGISLGFRLEPHFHQTWWFYLMCAVAVALAGEGLYLFRIRQMRARQTRLEGLVAQRTAQLQEANRDLERLSLVDPLTGIANRRQFERVLEAEHKRSERNGTPLSLMMCDLDFFKQLNDAFGHLVGDDCLKRVADTLSRCVRGAGDLVARYGGEEFAVVLPGAGVEGAAALAHRMCVGVEALHIPRSETELDEIITISLGVATAGDVRNVPTGSLVARADEALYRAKAEGRNRVVVAESAS